MISPAWPLSPTAATMTHRANHPSDNAQRYASSMGLARAERSPHMSQGFARPASPRMTHCGIKSYTKHMTGILDLPTPRVRLSMALPGTASAPQ